MSTTEQNIHVHVDKEKLLNFLKGTCTMYMYMYICMHVAHIIYMCIVCYRLSFSKQCVYLYPPGHTYKQ